MSYPHLSLKDLTIDPRLVGRVPAALARYHLAIPVAEENGLVTLVMLHPDNPKVARLFADLFDSQIFPVQGDSDEIRATLNILYPGEVAGAPRPALHWSSQGGEASLDYARRIAAAFQIETLDASHNSLSSLINIAGGEGDFNFIAFETDGLPPMQALLQDARASLLFTRGVYPDPRRILVALQGHSPDHQAVHSALTLAHHFGAQMTLLGVAAPMKRQAVQGIASLLDPASPAGEHIGLCLGQIQAAQVRGLLKLRQGSPDEQITAEFHDGGYDMLVMPVETYGGFVYRVLETLESRYPDNRNPVLAVKPLY